MEEDKGSEIKTPARAREALADYAKGPLALLSPAILILTILAYGELGQWGPSRVLALSLGLSGSMAVTNGFIQAISRRGSICISLSDRRAARQFFLFSIAIAGACVLTVAALAVFAATELGLFTPYDRLVFALAFASLSVIWLLSAGLSLQQAPGWLGAGLAAGLATGLATEWIVAQLAYWRPVLLTAGSAIASLITAWAAPNLSEARLILELMGGAMARLVNDWAVAPLSPTRLVAGTIVGFVVATATIIHGLNRAFGARAVGRPSRVVLPHFTYLIFEASPYFAYGSLYMAFISLPHALGWFAALGLEAEPMQAISTLEVGLTLSLPPVIMAGGVAEHTLRLFWRKALTAQAATPGEDPGQFGRTLTKFYRRQLLQYLAVLGCLSLLAYAAFHVALSSGLLVGWQESYRLDAMELAAALGIAPLPEWRQMLVLDASELVFLTALFAYWLLGWGIFNSIFSVTLARPRLAVRAVISGMAVTALAGAPLTIGLSFSYAGVAFMAGALVFAAVSFWTTTHMLKSADYCYFSSF